jgi:pimeloyl-ACP methyl ester carboxylesterase
MNSLTLNYIAWGAMFGSRFAAKQPKGLRRYIIMSSAPSISLWIDAQNGLRRTLPQDVQDTMDKCEKEGTTDSREYQAAMGLYYSQFLCRLDPMPEEILQSLALLEADPTVYAAMFVPSHFSTVVSEVN